MEIKGKVHCFFEQSGTFKNEFKKLGIPAFDYDLQDHFGQTDHKIDLFNEIETAYRGGQSVFDSISKEDLIMAFFPCIYFDCLSQMNFGWYNHNYAKLGTKGKADAILERSANREKFFRICVMMFAVAEMKGIRLIMENPWSMQTFLKANFIFPPALVDNDRSKRGDFYKKPTAYWFMNCKPTHGKSYQQLHKPKRIVDQPHEKGGGLCSEVRSMISPDYARNFICDFILGKEQEYSERSLFDE